MGGTADIGAANVVSLVLAHEKGIGFTFVACKQTGKWHIKEGSIQEPRVTVVIQNIPVVEHQ